MTAPKYNTKDVLYLGHANSSMPDKIYIASVYQKDTSKEWMYNVLSECNCGYIYMSESEITKRLSRHTSKCYSLTEIKELLQDGYRFCGNFDKSVAKSRANGMKSMKNVQHIRLYNALNNNGVHITGCYGIWVKYNLTIEDTGEQMMPGFNSIPILVK